MHYRTILAAALLALGGVSTTPCFARSIDQVLTLPGKASRWDYLAFDAGRVFIARGAAGVTVFDIAIKKGLGPIVNSEGAGAATLVPGLDRGCTTNHDGSTTVFTLSTLKTIARMPLTTSRSPSSSPSRWTAC